jgi:hypothetical protein
MARKSKKSSQSPVVLGIVVVAVLALAVSVFLVSRSSQPYRTTDSLDVASYLENANSLRGNTYRLDGEVLNALAMSPTQGRLISVQPEEGGVLPLMIPSNFNSMNIQRGQRFVFMVEVDERGILQVTDMTKS